MTGDIEDGGPAFPSRRIAYHKTSYSGSTPTNIEPVYQDAPGMTLRDYFATAVDKDEYGDLIYRNASRSMMEAVAGPHPEDPSVKHGRAPTREEIAAYQLEKIDWKMRFRAAIRYRLADAMLKERAK